MAKKITALSVIRSYTDAFIFNDKMKDGGMSFKIGYSGTGVEAEYMVIVKELNQLGFVATLQCNVATVYEGGGISAPSSSYTHTTYRINVNMPFVVV